MKLKKTVMAALFAALTCVATFVIRIPISFGYINLGDCMVLLSGWFLGPVYAFLSAGIGSAIADISSGYIIYAPVTFLIKGIMALVGYYLFKAAGKKSQLTGNIISGLIAEIIMVGGYYIFEGFMYGFGGALASLPANAVQGIAGIIGACLLYLVFKKHLIKIIE